MNVPELLRAQRLPFVDHIERGVGDTVVFVRIISHFAQVLPPSRATLALKAATFSADAVRAEFGRVVVAYLEAQPGAFEQALARDARAMLGEG
jgi:hypothetical protein